MSDELVRAILPFPVLLCLDVLKLSLPWIMPGRMTLCAFY